MLTYLAYVVGFFMETWFLTEPLACCFSEVFFCLFVFCFLFFFKPVKPCDLCPYLGSAVRGPHAVLCLAFSRLIGIWTQVLKHVLLEPSLEPPFSPELGFNCNHFLAYCKKHFSVWRLMHFLLTQISRKSVTILEVRNLLA